MAKQPVVDGIGYRSKVEAHWARLFGYCKLAFHYQPGPYDISLDGTRKDYTPDFYLPELECFVEIKYSEEKSPLPKECFKASRLSVVSKRPVYIFFGQFGTGQRKHGSAYRYDLTNSDPSLHFSVNWWISRCPKCQLVDITQDSKTPLRCGCFMPMGHVSTANDPYLLDGFAQITRFN